MAKVISRSTSARGFTLVQLLITVAIAGVVMAMALPQTSQLVGTLRLSGDARSLTNAVALTKLRAASHFTKARLYVVLTDKSYHIETWQKSPGAWVTDATDGTSYLTSTNTESFGYSSLSSPPSNTQAAIGQAPACLTGAGVAIGNTACVVFNSRGIPITDVAASTGGPTNSHALYINDGSVVYGVTVSATSVIQLWRTRISTPSWTLQ
jgi:type IV fimbrial biogenesis protein FimT